MDEATTKKPLMDMESQFETSESITKMATALMEFQGKVELVKKTAENDFFKSKYADLGSIIDTIKKPLADAKLSYVQMPFGTNKLVTILMHESGEFFKSIVEMTPKGSSPQDVGSAITYYRRYSLSAILGIATEEDDDGNAASGAGERTTRPAKTETKAPAKPASKPGAKVDPLFEKAKKNLQANVNKKQLEEYRVKIEGSDKYNAGQKKELITIIDEQIKKAK